MDLSLSNVINVSVAEQPQGIGRYNTSNLGLFTSDVAASSFGILGYKIYLEPSEVGTDFGTTSVTYQQALAIFSQQPNILAGGGYLVVILLRASIQTVTWSASGDAGGYRINYGGNHYDVVYSDSISSVQAGVRTIAGLEDATVTGSANTTLVITLKGVYNPALVTITNITMTHTAAPVTATVVETAGTGETLGAAITRTKGLVQYFGILINDAFGDNADLLTTAAVVQALNKILFAVSVNEAAVQSGGAIDLLRTGNFSHTRGLYYGDASAASLNAILMSSAYAGRGLSVDFTGSNTTLNMNLKDLATIQPDPSMTETIYTECQTAGADVYASVQGVPKVLCSGANSFFDQVYNLLSFVGDLQVAGFNFLAETSTKVPQTENGIDAYKGSFRGVCEQYVTNQYIAPGAWNSPTTFGNLQDFLANIRQVGYYIYSQPVAQQSQASRVARNAPLVQIAIKEAGAVDKGNVIVNINP